MDETLLDDALLMREATAGDPELLAVDLWLHEMFVALREQRSDPPLPPAGELPQ